MLSDKDYGLLDEVFQKLKQADNTCSDIVLDSEEVRVLVNLMISIMSWLRLRRLLMSLKKR